MSAYPTAGYAEEMPPYEWAPGALERLPEDIEPYEALQVVAPSGPDYRFPASRKDSRYWRCSAGLERGDRWR